MMKRLSGLVLLLCLANFLSAQDMRMDTYCRDSRLIPSL